MLILLNRFKFLKCAHYNRYDTFLFSNFNLL